jgi:hypothetical protein
LTTERRKKQGDKDGDAVSVWQKTFLRCLTEYDARAPEGIFGADQQFGGVEFQDNTTKLIDVERWAEQAMTTMEVHFKEFGPFLMESQTPLDLLCSPSAYTHLREPPVQEERKVTSLQVYASKHPELRELVFGNVCTVGADRQEPVVFPAVVLNPIIEDPDEG